METEIRDKLGDKITHPIATDFLQRFFEAARFDSTLHPGVKYTMCYSITQYFIDMALLDETLVHTRPSLIAAAAIMCTLRVLGRRDWSAQLEYYTTYRRETVAALAEKLIANGRACTASAISHKYTSQRLGGVGDQVGADGKTLNDGCLHILAGYFKQLL
jgi:cyclin B